MSHKLLFPSRLSTLFNFALIKWDIWPNWLSDASLETTLFCLRFTDFFDTSEVLYLWALLSRSHLWLWSLNFLDPPGFCIVDAFWPTLFCFFLIFYVCSSCLFTFFCNLSRLFLFFRKRTRGQNFRSLWIYSVIIGERRGSARYQYCVSASLSHAPLIQVYLY